MLRNNVPSCWGNTDRYTDGLENKQFKVASRGKKVAQGTACGTGNKPESPRKPGAAPALG